MVMSEGTRRYDIDWLRVIAMSGIFLLHTMHLFDEGTDWHLRNADTSTLVLILRGLIDIWAVPTFFVLSGAGAWFALKRRTGSRFLAERVQRLLVPLYSVGLFAIVLPQIYFDAFTNGYRGSFGVVIARSLGSVGFDPSWPGLATFFPGHLWFLQFLFLVSVVVIPVLLLLRSARGGRLITQVAGWCDHRGGIFLLIVPIALVRVALMGFIRGQFTWATFVFFAVLFVIGYMLVADDRFRASITRNRWIALVLGILSFGAQGFLMLTQGYDMFYEPFSGIFVVYQVILSIGIWGFIVFLMGITAKRLNRPSPALAYANEAVLPFYLFHQTVILGIGWFVIRWNMGIWPKLIIVTVTSFAATLLLYDVFVRHSNVMRFFFGMRPKRTSG
jgi:surface polysaccharide O-acyltransferase-like enzyme